MHILIITPEYPPYGSGISNVVYMIQKYLIREGFSVDVIGRPYENGYLPPGLSSLIPFWQNVQTKLRKIHKNYDAIWLHQPVLFNPQLNFCKKTIITFHSSYYGFYKGYKEHNIWFYLPYYLFAKRLEHHLLRKISKDTTVTTVSPSVAEELTMNGLKFDPYVIPNSVENLDQKKMDKAEARDALKKFSIRSTKEDFLLLYIGRITEVKQPLLLVDLFKKIRDLSNVHLIIAGSGNLLKKLSKKAAFMQNLHILGHVKKEDAFLLREASDAFISLSCYEGSPVAVLEAASSRLPVILSNIAAHRSILELKLASGMIVNSIRPDPTYIQDFIKNYSNINLNTTSLLENYSWPIVIQKYISLLQN